MRHLGHAMAPIRSDIGGVACNAPQSSLLTFWVSDVMPFRGRAACLRVVAIDKKVDSEAGVEIEEDAVGMLSNVHNASAPCLEYWTCSINYPPCYSNDTLLSPVAEQMEKMDKTFEAVKRNFATVRTGRANPGMLDRVEVVVLS